MSRDKNRIKGRDRKGAGAIDYTPPAISKLEYPVFCFRHLHADHKLENIPAEDKVKLIERLEKLAQLGFSEIYTSQRHGFGWEKIWVGSLNVKPPSFITSEVEFLFALRYNGKCPFLVHRLPNSPILHLIFIDHNFSVYNHGG